MDNNTLTAIVVVVIAFVILAIIGMFVKQRFTGSVKAPGVEMKVGAEDAANAERTGKTRSGIFGNLSIGRTRIEVKGNETIADNRSIGDTEMKADSQSRSATPSSKTRNKR
jgi:hypothetical protein